MFKLPVAIICLSLLLPCSAASANTITKNSMSFESWIERLRDDAFAKGISVDTLRTTFLRNKELDLFPRLQTSPPENTNTLQENLAFSKLLLEEYNDPLFEISHLFGIKAEVLVAIVSMENQSIEYFPAIDILINRSFLQPRNNSLQNELIQALKIVDEGQIEVEQLKSDIYGRLGKIRFKPTRYREYAIDFDTDGRYDLWQNYADIFASTANYLSNIGWQSGQDWGIEVNLPEDFDLGLISINHQKTLNKWLALGISRINDEQLPDSTTFGSLIQMENGKHYIVQENYFALLRWKRSVKFAYAVGQLMDLMKPPSLQENIKTIQYHQ